MPVILEKVSVCNETADEGIFLPSTEDMQVSQGQVTLMRCSKVTCKLPVLILALAMVLHLSREDLSPFLALVMGCLVEASSSQGLIVQGSKCAR